LPLKRAQYFLYWAILYLLGVLARGEWPVAAKASLLLRCERFSRRRTPGKNKITY
jgi:hypothetical protein